MATHFDTECDSILLTGDEFAELNKNTSMVFLMTHHSKRDAAEVTYLVAEPTAFSGALHE